MKSNFKRFESTFTLLYHPLETKNQRKSIILLRIKVGTTKYIVVKKSNSSYDNILHGRKINKQITTCIPMY